MMFNWRFLFLSLIAFQSISSFGQSASSTKADPAGVQAHIGKIASCISPPVIVKGEPPSCTALAQRMAELHVPGLSIAVIHNGATAKFSRSLSIWTADHICSSYRMQFT